MKGFIRKGVTVAAVLCVFLSGCGTSVAQLTEDEEQIIVAYASGAVAKANKHQKQGLTYPPAEEEEVPVEEPSDSDEENEVQEEQSPDSSSGQDRIENQTEETAEEMTFTEALNISGLTAEYHGYQVKENYMEGDYFALYAEAGKMYLIVNVGLTNTTEQPLECNLLGKNLQCSLWVNGTEVADAAATILLTDFISYINTLEAGASEETIMIFELAKEEAEAIEQIGLRLTVDGTSYQIKLD